MARSAFVKTTTKRLDLTGDWEGQWVDVKEHLGVNDQQRINGSAFTSLRNVAPGRPAEEAEALMDLGRMYMTQLKVYLVGWSFTDETGKAVELTPTAIDMLDPDCASEITKALNAWLEERGAAKDANPTGTTSSAQRSA